MDGLANVTADHHAVLDGRRGGRHHPDRGSQAWPQRPHSFWPISRRGWSDRLVLGKNADTGLSAIARIVSLCIGLTGGIGSGKSTVAALFAEHGAGIVDTDAIARRLTETGGGAIEAIRAAFGSGYITNDGALDRAKMRGLIFSDDGAKQRLEHILHPLIRKQAKVQLRQLQDKPYIILVVPLLPESPAFRQLVQRVLVVDCDENTRIARVIDRNKMTGEEVRAILARQTPRAERLELADDVIRNDTGMDSLSEQVSILHERYTGAQSSL
ncbi:MAG: dephospho-CoA kinase [Nitrosomonadales bacterium]|nr:dephospho-CoA kinase [Nitrosomonadales bacterium]